MCAWRVFALSLALSLSLFTVEDGGATVVFLTISRLNHDCDANARMQWDPAASEASIICKRTIAPGTEVTLNYGASGGVDERQRHLLERFGFACTCVSCTEGVNISRS